MMSKLKDMILFWGAGSAPCWRAMACLNEKELHDRLESKEMDFDKNEHKSEEVMKLNPRGQLPTFKHGDIVLNESVGICLYLEEVFKDQGTRLIPDKVNEKAAVFQKMHEAPNLYEKGMVEIAYYVFLNKPEDVKQEHIASRKKILQEELKLWEGYLAETDETYHIATKDFSMADIMFFPNLAMLVFFGLSLESRPNLKRYHSLMSQRESSKKLMKIHLLEAWKRDLFGDV